MAERNIQLFTPSYRVDECLAEIRECLDVGWTGMGFKTLRFEEAWRTHTGLPSAHFLSSNTVGLHLALRIFKVERAWNDGDEVITTPLTFVSTNHAILYERLRPVFADVDETLCLAPESIQERITPRTRAVLYVGMGGNPGRLADVVSVCRQRGLLLILDAAHMSGTYVGGRHAGHGVDCAVFSFHAVKNLPTADGGMICFQEPRLDAEARKWSWLGISRDTYARAGAAAGGRYKWLYDVEHVGLKAHGNSVMAAIGLVQLKYLEVDNTRRREIVARYEGLLGGAPKLGLIPLPKDCLPSRHLFQIRVPEAVREELIIHLNSKGISPGVHYRCNTEYDMYRYGSGTCPNAERFSRELVSLPLHLRLSDEDVGHVAGSVLEFMRGQP